MIGNIFDLYPEFVDTDIRKNRKRGYKVDSDFLHKRHIALLPEKIIKDKTVLDLGAAVGASGAWCLHHGAKHYTGVDVNVSEISKNNLTKYFNSEKWQWFGMDVHDYLLLCPDEYDIVLMSGILYFFDDHAEILNLISAKTIIIDTENVNQTEFKPASLYKKNTPNGKRKCEPKSYYDKVLADFTYDDSFNIKSRELLPEHYNDNGRVMYCYHLPPLKSK